MRFLVVFVLAFWLATVVHASKNDFYVAPNGRDNWSGKLAAPNKAGTDGPLLTLERALDVQSAARKTDQVDGPVTIWLRGGNYYRDKSFVIPFEKSGTSFAPLTIRAYKNEVPRIIGGKPLIGFVPVIDPAILERLEPAARDHVQQVSVPALGIKDYGRILPLGQGFSNNVEMPELFLGSKRMTLARWPNTDWATIADVPAEGHIRYEGDRPARWKTLDDVWLYGYWKFDWADSYQQVTAVDTAKKEITTPNAFAPYGAEKGKRYFVLNALEELDAPGEWYLDRKTGILYFWSPTLLDDKNAPILSVVQEPLIQTKGANCLRFQGLTVEMGRGDGIVLDGGVDNLVAGCTLRYLGRYGARIENGNKSGVQSCDIYETGLGGVALSAGDRQTLTPGECFAVNNHIHHVSRLIRTYQPAVALAGVGNHVAHNRIHDLPHTAIQGGGNDHLIEYNEIYRVCQETGDAGAFYMGRDFTQRGNVVQYNYFHDLRAGGLAGQTGFTEVMGVYLDDCFSGVKVYGNLFVRAGRSAMIGGGRDNTIENNIFVDGSPAVHVDSRGKGWASKYFVPNGEWRIFETYKELNADQPPYSTRYPQLVNLLNDDPALAKGNRILRNISVGGKWLEMQDNLTDKIVEFKDNYVDKEPGFVNPAKEDYHLKSDSPVWKLGFKPLPIEKMGLQKDAYWKVLPPK